MKTEDLSAFLLEEGDVVVSQIHISKRILKGNSAKLETYSSRLKREGEPWLSIDLLQEADDCVFRLVRSC